MVKQIKIERRERSHPLDIISEQSNNLVANDDDDDQPMQERVDLLEPEIENV